MILTTLPNVETHTELFFKYKQPDENLGVVKFQKKDLHFGTTDQLVGDVKCFLETGMFIKDINWNKRYVDSSYIYYQQHIENYVKLVWLSEDYIRNAGFKNPIGVHWNPRYDRWDIHPGGSRQKVLFLYENKTINTIAFNTGGKRVKFEKIFDSKESIHKHYSTTDANLVLVADHGSLIPHVHFDQAVIKNNIKKTYHEIQNFFNYTKITANFDLRKWGYNPDCVKKVNKEINLTVNKPKNELSVVRALTLLPKFDNYVGHGVKIECT